MIRTIIFDVGEVIIGGFKGFEERISKAIGKTVTNRDLHENNDELNAFFMGEISEDILWKCMKQRFGWNIRNSELEEMVREGFVEVPGTLEIISDLDACGDFRLALLSVHGQEWVEYIRQKFDFHDYFSHEYYSCEIGLCKPDPGAFQYVLNDLNIQPRSILFIDDRSENITVAARFGFRTHCFTDAAKLRFELNKIGLI